MHNVWGIMKNWVCFFEHGVDGQRESNLKIEKP